MQQNDVSIQERFERFHEENPFVYSSLLDLARHIKNKGYKHYSMDGLMHVARFEIRMQTSDPNFKINNNYSSRYARKMIAEYPEFDGFFSIRELKTK